MNLPLLRAVLVFSLIFSAALPPGRAQPAPAPAGQTGASYAFPPADLMRIGVYYYPQAWPADQWPRDMANIKKMGMEFVHMGEFDWAFMEPTEGKFDFSWLDQTIALAAAQGLKVVLCTPSAAPPIWLTAAHPEVLMIDAAGHQMQHGTRQQASWSVPLYREYVGKIVTALGQRYGKDPRVWGWQLDNELSHYGKEPDYGPASQASFRTWLRNKYGTIAALNRDWGNAFWSEVYQNFDQIRLPNQQEQVAQMNPHSLLDAQRWFADETAGYLRFQTDILRQFCGHDQWITTNHMHDFAAVNPALNGKDFDLVTWTIYPVHGNANEGPLGFRLGSSATLSFAADFMRTINGQTGIMELQPGQVNWGDVNPQPYPGAVRLWLMRAFAAGAKFVCTYRYREPLSGPEMYHNGLVGTDGITPSIGGEQYVQAMKEIASLRPLWRADARPPAAYAARQAAVFYSFEDRWDLDNHKQNVAWDTYGHLLKYHTALKRLGAPVDVITEDKDFSAYPFLVVPAAQLVDPALVARWKTYAENGGHLILTCRTGQKDRRGFLWEGPWSMPILDLIGAKIKFYDTLPAPNVAHVKNGEQTHAWSSWGEILEPEAGTTVVARYTDQFYAGAPAAVTRPLGKGSVTYIGVDTTDGELEAQLVRGVYARAGVGVEDFAPGFDVDWRDGFWIATNFSAATQAAPVPEGMKLLVGERNVPVAGVAIWQP